MNRPTDKQVSEDIAKLFAQVRRLPLDASPYLETRVLAQWRGRARELSPMFWRRLALGSSAVSALLVLVLTLSFLKPATYDAFVDQQFVVRVELKSFDQTRIAKSKIELPDGVFFEVENYPELRNERSLTLRWFPRAAGEDFPIVLSAHEAGMKTVRVKFLDANNAVVAERTFRINLLVPKRDS